MNNYPDAPKTKYKYQHNSINPSINDWDNVKCDMCAVDWGKSWKIDGLFSICSNDKVYCGKCIVWLENNEPDFALGLEALVE